MHRLRVIHKPPNQTAELPSFRHFPLCLFSLKIYPSEIQVTSEASDKMPYYRYELLDHDYTTPTSYINKQLRNVRAIVEVVPHHNHSEVPAFAK